ncbi:MAG: hypothetical protein RLZ12_971 [Bacillota bacterium]
MVIKCCFVNLIKYFCLLLINPFYLYALTYASNKPPEPLLHQQKLVSHLYFASTNGQIVTFSKQETKVISNLDPSLPAPSYTYLASLEHNPRKITVYVGEELFLPPGYLQRFIVATDTEPLLIVQDTTLAQVVKTAWLQKTLSARPYLKLSLETYLFS